MGPLIYAVAAGIVIACGSVLEKLGLSTTQPYAALFVRAGAIVFALTLSLFPLRDTVDFGGFTPRTVALLAVGGIFSGLVAHFLYWQSLKATSPDFALPVMVSASQIGVVLFSASLLRTRLSLGQVTGIAFVIAGVWLIQMMKPR